MPENKEKYIKVSNGHGMDLVIKDLGEIFDLINKDDIELDPITLSIVEMTTDEFNNLSEWGGF